MNTSGIVSRISAFLEQADPLMIIGGMGALFLILGLAVFQQRLGLVFLLILSLTVDAASIRGLGSAATLGRFFMIFVMGCYVLTLRQSPGKPWWMFMSYVALGLLYTAKAGDPLYSIQWGGLTLASGLAVASLVEYVTDVKKATRICSSFVICAMFWGLLGMASLLNLGVSAQSGARFAGFTTSPGIFVQTGGMLLPFAVWGMMRPWNQMFRIACGVLTMAMVLVLLASAQRTGTFAGIIACLPLLLRAKFGKLLIAAIVIGGCTLVVVKVSQMDQAQTNFAKKRFTSTSTSQRTSIWSRTLPILFRSPILGRGFGSNKELLREIGNTVHNMYLQIWYDTGIIGLAIFIAGGVLAGWQAFVLMLKAKNAEINEMSRLMFGLLLSSAATGMFATGAASPSDFATMGYLIAMIMASRLVILNSAVVTQTVDSPAWSGYHAPQGYATAFASGAYAQAAYPPGAFGPAAVPQGPQYSYWFWPQTTAPGPEPPRPA